MLHFNRSFCTMQSFVYFAAEKNRMPTIAEITLFTTIYKLTFPAPKKHGIHDMISMIMCNSQA